MPGPANFRTLNGKVAPKMIQDTQSPITGNAFDLVKAQHDEDSAGNSKRGDDQKLDTIISGNSFDRMVTSLDDDLIRFQDEKPKTAADNKELYMKNYAIRYTIPSLYVYDSKMYPLNPRYTIQLINYCYPE